MSTCFYFFPIILQQLAYGYRSKSISDVDFYVAAEEIGVHLSG
jgi:hypothetical protein